MITMNFNQRLMWHDGSGQYGGTGGNINDFQNGRKGTGSYRPYGKGGYDGNGSAENGAGRGNGGYGGFGGQKGFSITSLLEDNPNAQLLFVGAVSCTRHRGFQMGDLMRAGKMAILSPTATDFATGRYLHQIMEAVVELSEERSTKDVVVMYGCQCALLSTDFELMAQELKEKYDINLKVHEHCHLCRTDDEGWHTIPGKEDEEE